MDVQGDLAKLVRVLLAVVRAEEQFESAGHDYSDVGLSPAAVATIRGVQSGTFDD